jgi:hypothetical protein
MKIFYGSAIQGATDRSTRTHIHDALIAKLKALGHSVFSEHLRGNSVAETAQLLKNAIGEFPPPGIKRAQYIRKVMLEAVESDIDAAIFEVSVPSLGTGIELAHAYLRPRMGLKPIAILTLYETGYWPHHLSAMIRGITEEELPNLKGSEYATVEKATSILEDFLKNISD